MMINPAVRSANPLPALQTAANLGKFGGTNQLPQIPSGNRPAPPLTS